MAGGSYYEVQVRPDASGWSTSLESQLDPVIRRQAESIRRQLQDAVRQGLNGNGVNNIRQGSKAADEYADAFSRTIRTKLKAALENLPDVKLNANSTDVDRKLADIRAKLKAADDQIKLGVDDKVALAQLTALRAQLRSLSNDADVRVRLNAGSALKELESLKSSLSDDGKRGNLFSSLISDLRAVSPLLDQIIGKLGAVGGSLSNFFQGPGGTIAQIGIIVALLSTIGPLAAAATGALIGVAGAAGVAGLAFLGLKKQFDQGTGFGAAIRDEFKGIGAEIEGLSQVAANALGPAIKDVLGFVHEALPQFEGLITVVGGRLGGALREVGGALVTGLLKAQPLIVEVSQYILDGAAAFRRWVVSDSFQKFIDYARKELPQVITFIKDIGKTVIDFFVSFAPLGEKVLKVLDFLVKSTGETAKLLGSVSSGALGGITSFFSSGTDKAKENAAQVDSLLASYQNLFSGTAQAAEATGPLTQYVTVIGDLTPQLVAATGNSGQLAAATQAIADRLNGATPAMAEFISTAQSYDATTAKGADTAKLLGDALTASRGNLLDYTATMVGADSATQSLAKTLHDSLSSVAKDGTLLGISHLDTAGKFVAAAGKYTEGSQSIVQAFQSQVKAATDAATATYSQELATKGQAVAANDALTVYKGYRDELVAQAKQAGLTQEQVQALTDQYFAIPPDVDTFVKLLGQGDVNIAIQGLTDALNRLSDFIGAPQIKLNAADFNTGMELANGQLDYFGNRVAVPSAELNTADFNTAQQLANQQLDYFGNRVATPSAGLSTNDYSNSLAIANSKLDYFGNRVAVPTVGINDQASAAATRIQNAIDRIHGRTVEVNIGGDGYLHGSAHGNIFSTVGKAYAMGGIVDKLKAAGAVAQKFAFGSENHVAQIALPNGGFRMWAEPETQGEAYIPFAQDRRARAEDIVGDVAKRFGGVFLSKAALTGAAGAGGGGSSAAIVAAVNALGSRIDQVSARDAERVVVGVGTAQSDAASTMAKVITYNRTAGR